VPAEPRGLSSQQASQRLAQVGPNRLVPTSQWGRLRAVVHAFADPMALMLAATGSVYLLLGEKRDGFVLLAALVPVLWVDLVLQARSQRALAALAAAVAPTARVVRDARETEVATEDLVPGDLVLLREGELVFADAKVTESSNLALDESTLTGESEPILKALGTALYAGSRVLAGSGAALVTATGAHTSYGQVAALVAAAGGETPLQRRVGHLVRRVGAIALALAALVFAAGIARGQGLATAFLGAVSLAMAAFPEEFLLVFTLFLSLGAWRLARRQVLVRRLTCVESLGSVTVLCADKTGTLTQGRFALDRHLALGGDDPELLTAAALACEPALDDPLERGIAAHAQEHGIDLAALHARWSLAVDHPFEPAGRHMTHVWAQGDRVRVVMKGALEGVLEHCAIDAAGRAAAERGHAELAAAGMRVLAVAARDLPAPAAVLREAVERDLVLLGLLGFRDPLRPEVPAAVAAVRRAGIRVVMITGDHALTARAIAEAAGIPVSDDSVATGPELAALGDADRAARLARASVLARVRPEQKHAIVASLERSGEVVAMTGDGVNDAAALRRAAVGISMGQRASEVARSAAGLVLLDDDLGALVATIREGRRIHANLQRAFLFLVAFHLPIVGLAVVPPILGLPLVLLPIHLVWLELIVHPIAALVFEAEPAPADAMERPPRRRDEPILPRALLARAVASGAALAAGALAVFVAQRHAGMDAARAAALVVVIVGGLALVVAERALDRPWWRVPWPRGARFWIVCGLVAVSLPLAIGVPALARALHLAAPAPLAGAVAAALGIAAVAWRAGGVRGARPPAGPRGAALV
jgi:Ca2+-transporting ATPase